MGYDFWKHPGLVLSQTYGYPYRTVLKNHVNLIETPDFGLKECPAGHYYSAFIVHRDSKFEALSDLDDHFKATGHRANATGSEATHDLCKIN